jgi:hypothetical protein
MELKSFRELLLKKAADNPTLQTIIDVMKDELIAEKVLESLEKMARPQASMGRGANAAVTAFGNQMKNKDVEMMRDALAHHVSHYKAALKNGQRDIADKHLNKIVPLMHLAGKAAAHSNGQLGLDYVPLEPWETNYTSTERRPETGKLKEGTKGLRRRLNSSSRDKNPRSVPNYHYLEMKPHEGHADVAGNSVHLKGHQGGYPFEEIQIGSPAKIDSGEAHLHLQDVSKQDAYVPHPFDEHPIHQVADAAQDSLNPKDMEEFANKMSDWHNSPHNAKWMQDLKQAHGADPEGFKARGKKKPGHFFEGMPLQRQPHAIPDELAHLVNKPQEATAPATAAAPAPAAKAPAAVSPKDLSHLPAALRAKFGGGK